MTSAPYRCDFENFRSPLAGCCFDQPHRVSGGYRRENRG